MLRRKFYNTLLEWKNCHKKECLLVKGARQIGKTFIIDQFGKENYESYLYINFILRPECREIFEENFEADNLFKRLTVFFQDFKLIPGKTLIFLDEIQKCPKARTAFKSFAIDGRADVTGSGSLLGLTFLNDGKELNLERSESSIPVGYERQLMMQSLDFEEFLWALGYNDNSVEILREAFNYLTPLPSSSNEKMLRLYREYIVVGGMPEAVVSFVEDNSFSSAYDVQRKIIDANLDDIAKYAMTVDKPKIRACYLSIPSQLAKENSKFKYSLVEKGGSSRKFKSSIDWLRESALVLQCYNVETPLLPLFSYKRNDSFKLFASDIGILVGMLGFDVKLPIVDNTLSGPAKGGLYENAIMSALVRRGYSPCYYMPKSNTSEIDFVIEKNSGVVPIEIKAGNESSSSFNKMLERSDVKVGYKFVNGNIGKVGKKITLPHYMAMFL